MEPHHTAPTADPIPHTVPHPPACAGRGVQDTSRSNCPLHPQDTPAGEFLPLGASLSCGDRPGAQACRATLLAPPRSLPPPPPTPGPATLTTPSRRLPSPPGTGSGIARAPPRRSCSAPAGRTWASPATSSSGGSAATRWPSGGPCLQPHALLCALSLARGRPDPAPAQVWRLRPTAPVSRGGSYEPRQRAGAGCTVRRSSRRGPLAAAPWGAHADAARQPLALQRPLGLQWPRSPAGSGRGGSSRTLARTAPRAETLPNMEPARRAGVREKSARDGQISREERRGSGS